MRLIIALLISVLLIADDLKKITLTEFARMVSDVNNMSIYIDEDIDATQITFYNPMR
jgi:hypothetical protein